MSRSIGMMMSRSGRSLRGSVDRNELDQMMSAIYAVAPFAGAWIETRCDRASRDAAARRRSLRGSVDRNSKMYVP